MLHYTHGSVSVKTRREAGNNGFLLDKHASKNRHESDIELRLINEFTLTNFISVRCEEKLTVCKKVI